MDTDTTFADFAARLARVEKSNRRLRLALGAVVVAASAGVLGAAAMQDSRAVVDEVRARRLVVIDSAGTPTIALGLVEDGATGIEIRGSNGKPAVLLRASKGASGLTFLSDEATISLGVLGGNVRAALEMVKGVFGRSSGSPETQQYRVPAALFEMRIGDRITSSLEAFRDPVFADSRPGSMLTLLGSNGEPVELVLRPDSPVIGK
jgi:hypothetical protein